jgi:D-threo-aldose 1-dehydrogenase
MRTKTLGRTRLDVPAIGIGTAFLGFNGRDAWVDAGSFAADPELGVPALRAFLDAGQTLIDTAPLYGGGRVETLIGEALREYDVSRYLLMTKAGRTSDGYDFSADAVRNSVAESLERLGVDRIDIVCVHDAMGRFDDVMGRGGALEGLRQLQDEGMIGFVGVACSSTDTNADFIETGEFDVAVVPGAWSLINQTLLQRIAPAAEKHDVGLLAGTPFERGLLVAGVASSPEHPSNRVFSDETIEHVQAMKAVCEAHGYPLFAVALQWPSRHPRVAAAIPGARNGEEATANVQAANLEISEEFWAELGPMIRHWEIGRT